MMNGMEAPGAIPRVVRVSNVRDLKQSLWIALPLIPLWAFCAYHEVPRLGKVHAEDWFTFATAIGFVVLPVFCFLIPALQLFVTGTWIADDRGIEFMPYAPRVRRWRFMWWDEIERVKWVSAMATLEGGGDRIALVWKHLGDPADQAALKRRTEMSLRDHFDLSILPVRHLEISWRRILFGVALPTTTVLALYALAMGTGETRYMVACVALACAWGAAIYALMLIFLFRQGRNPQSPTRWRLRGGAANVAT